MSRCAASVALMMTAALTVGSEPEPEPQGVKPREIFTAGFPAKRGTVDAPTSIPDEERLAELIPKGRARTEILKRVDFRKERLLLFRWCGGPGDRLIPAEGRSGEAVFRYAASATDDCVLHAKLFAVPAKAKVKVTRR